MYAHVCQRDGKKCAPSRWDVSIVGIVAWAKIIRTIKLGDVARATKTQAYSIKAIVFDVFMDKKKLVTQNI